MLEKSESAAVVPSASKCKSSRDIFKFLQQFFLETNRNCGYYVELQKREE